MPFPFEVPFDQVQADLDTYVDEVFAALRSEFLTMPKGEGFIEYPVFEQGYEALKQVTGGFRNLPSDAIIETVYRLPVSLVVLRVLTPECEPRFSLTPINNSLYFRQPYYRSIGLDPSIGSHLWFRIVEKPCAQGAGIFL
jgi:hypothetical protein